MVQEHFFLFVLLLLRKVQRAKKDEPAALCSRYSYIYVFDRSTENNISDYNPSIRHIVQNLLYSFLYYFVSVFDREKMTIDCLV